MAVRTTSSAAAVPVSPSQPGRFLAAVAPVGLHALLLLLCLCMLAGCRAQPDPGLGVEGGCPPSRSPFLPEDPTVSGRISFCDGDDAWTGTLQTQPYPAGTRNIELMVTGYPNTSDVTFRAVSVDGHTTAVLNAPQMREVWQRLTLEIPEDVSRSGFRIEMDDQSKGKFGWAGMGASNVSAASEFAAGAFPLLAGVLLGNAWLIALALCLPGSMPAGERLLRGLLAAGCCWLLVFNAYVASAPTGQLLAWLLLLLPFPLALLFTSRAETLRIAAVDIQKYLLPTLVLAILILWVGLYPFHGTGQMNGEPALRWPHLSSDAWLPLLFGDMLARGQLDVPMVGDWLSSDRPPLQVGLYLLLHSVLPETRALVYQGVSTWAQALVLVPVLALLARFMSGRARVVALLVISLSALVVLNTLYVWPKLLAAAFCLMYYLALFPAEGKPRQWAQAGIAAAMALLSHGGSLFFLVGASLVHLAWYRRQSLTVMMRTGPVALLLYLPWIAYQRFVDPPGDRLVKWHFAGKVPVSDESAVDAITSAYSALTPGEWLASRWENVAVVVKGAFNGPLNAVRVLAGQDAGTINQFVDDSFFNTFHSLWLTSPLLLVPCLGVIYWRARSTGRSDPALGGLMQVLAVVTASLLIWIIAMFEGGSATVHVGAYAAVIMLHAAVLVALWRVSQPLFHVLSAGNIAVALSAYFFDRHFLPGVHAIYVFGTVVLFLGFVASAATAGRNPLHNVASSPQRDSLRHD